MEFFNSTYYPQFKKLEENWEEIRSEYDSISKLENCWPEREIHNGKWKVIGLKYKNKDLHNKSFAPITCEILDNIPNIYTYGFSIMEPNCEITPHIGESTDVLRCHLGLYTNPNCGIMVNGETYNWKDGEVVVFDDTLEHSAWNRGDSKRVIILLDFFKN